MSYLRRGVGAIGVAAIFLITLLWYWPAGQLWTLLSPWLPAAVELKSVQGSLHAGRIGEIVYTPRQGWPIGLGPVTWTWPGFAHLRLQAGQRQPWELDARLAGLGSHWRLTGGALDTFDMRQWPVALHGEWQGQLDAALSLTQCQHARGGLTVAGLEILAPEPISLGDGRLTLTCTSSSAPRLQAALADPPKLDLDANATFSATGGNGRLRGSLAADHPLATWWRLAAPDTSFPVVEKSFTW